MAAEMTYVQQIAELIDAEAHSGSGYWDEMNGPEAVLTKVSDTKFTITFPATWMDDDEDEPTGPGCLITIESA